MTLLTYWGRCTSCGAPLRVFHHELGRPKTRAGFVSKATQRHQEITHEDADGTFLCPRCDAHGRIVGSRVVCPAAADAA